MRLYDLARNGEAESRAGDPGGAHVAAEELGEDPALLVGGDAQSLVAHDDPNAVAAALAASSTVPPSGEYLIAFESRFPTTCASRSGIAAHGQRALFERDLEPVLRALRGVELRLLVEEHRQVDAFRRQVDALVLDPLDVEKVLEQRGQPARLCVDDAEVVPARIGLEVALEQERGESEHTRERRAQLVRDDVDELRLHPLALAELVVLCLELAAACLEPFRHRVEGVRQVADLAGPVLRQAVVELAGSEATGAGGDRADRTADRSRRARCRRE